MFRSRRKRLRLHTFTMAIPVYGTPSKPNQSKHEVNDEVRLAGNQGKANLQESEREAKQIQSETEAQRSKVKQRRSRAKAK